MILCQKTSKNQCGSWNPWDASSEERYAMLDLRLKMLILMLLLLLEMLGMLEVLDMLKVLDWKQDAEKEGQWVSRGLSPSLFLSFGRINNEAVEEP